MSKMSPLQLGQKLNLPAVSLEALKDYVIPEETAGRLKEAFGKGPEIFEMEARKEENSDLLVLALYLRWSMDTHFMYAIRGMNWDIFFETFRDLTQAAAEFTAQTGKPGLKNWAWIGYAIKMQLFRLGKLQFRSNVLESELEMNGETYPAGTKVLEVYFPVGESLDDEAVEENLTRGKEFFSRYYRQEYELFLCHSSFYRSV